ncbi:glycosyltransferase family 2 protein [Paenibacillus sp. FSL H7-0942]|jgi:cellulose synthase/poly-beta-1,6-N-acetylglucosamine synthase-like glycosyltransferase|uniref:Cellulose synthase/poly-beta-1,6-N-acetylglucosamine synthase-like glycosyltransferase n=2 Tax=Paenibacillus TaxID=44249 RepID=A0ABS4RMG3_PAEXY|nr:MULTISPECIES: glycosyltransferase family 2 protein [Paenibacillus]UOK65180.1 glycosyltransferase [Paenibacillus sp. OVF10]APO44763.1 glycosyl transferase family 2 [Paenibacillus xylanexedens]ETT36599.1 N-acetylglucosaminyltransferase [Paenibacillus sp. FSL R5-192]ETT51403.1 N-acetylglucosaminyltransferase [Paenibacillus sp. FSL H7-689]KAA8754840.1 glycosyltransferase [Paenibacillus sp. UASWS1643]
MLDAIFVTMQVILALLAVYQFTFSLFGLIKKKKKKHYPATKSFAVLVAAHNEEQVIGALMENLKQLDYPEDLYDVFVICDNCTDGTAQIVREHGLNACVRTNADLRGKGYAIEWMLKYLWKLPRQYDAVVMFDADNLVDRNFLLEMNDDLNNGSRVIQGYIDTKNPEDSWITAAYGVSYWYINRLWQLSRHNLNMANFLGGTGMCFETNLLKEIGWGATSLVEDLEFTMRSVQRNVYPVFNYDAKVFDEKPLTFKASARQRLRWMQGHFTVARRYFFPLLWQSIKERSLVKFDLAIYGANVYVVLLTFLMTAVMWVDMAIFSGPHIANIYGYFPLWVGFVAIGLNILTFLLSMALEKVTFAKVYLYLILFPIYLLSWYPITFYAFFTQNNKQWSHTQHTRVVRLDEVQSKQG